MQLATILFINLYTNSVKRLITFGMGLALMAVTATAQSVVIVDKDGVTHKFATEYVENITFTPVTVTPAIEFTLI